MSARYVDASGPSVRHPGGLCVGAFHPDVVGPCTQGPHLVYAWDGKRIHPEYAVATLQTGGQGD